MNNVKIIALFLFISLIISAPLVSCAADEPTPPSPAETLKYSIVLKTENGDAGNGALSLQYPALDASASLDGSASGADYSQVNALIAAVVHEKYDAEMLEGEDKAEFNYDLDTAEVMCATNDVFSVYFRGGYYVDGMAHDAIFSYTVNVDLQNNRLVASEEIIGDFAKLREAFEGGTFEQMYGQEALMENATFADMFTEYREDYGIYPPVYFTPTSFGVGVELVYALGGFAGFELPLADAAPFLNPECPVVSALINDIGDIGDANANQ